MPDDLREEAWSDQVGAGDGSGYGYGWHIETDDGTHRVHHADATPGCFSHVMLSPDEGRAVVGQTNTYSGAT